MASRRSVTHDRPLPTAQVRSQETVERLLAAAEDALREKGPEGATLREIADRAGLSLGIVYRRFADKDAVLRAVYTRFFERTTAANAAALSSCDWSQVPPRQIAEQLIAGMVAGYKIHRKLIRALVLYAHTHDDSYFRARADALRRAAFAHLAPIFAPHYSAMTHPDPAAAVIFGLTAVASVLQDCVLLPEKGAGNLGSATAEEVTRMFLCYVGLSGEAERKHNKRR